MKSTILLLAGLLFATAALAQKYELSGKIEGKDTGCVYLTIPDYSGGIYTDSVTVDNSGHFKFYGSISYVVKTIISEGPLNLFSGNKNMFSFYLDPGQSYIEAVCGDLGNANIDGSESNRIMRELYERRKACEDITGNVVEKVDVAYVTANPSSVLSAYILEGLKIDIRRKETLYSELTPEAKSSAPGRRIKESIDFARRALPGTAAADFASRGIDGDTVRLSDYRGRYVLLDFWGSWCKPCRAGHPHLLEVYAKYKKAGFEIIGIADDDRKPDAWNRAVAEDGIGEWKHVLRGLDMVKFSRGDTNYMNYPDEISASRYGISSYPTKILIDPSGVIVDRYGSNITALDEKLKDLFGF